MKKEELFNDDFLKQFKTGEELNGFLKELQKRGIEKMLEGELDGHLDYGRLHLESVGEDGKQESFWKGFKRHVIVYKHNA